MKLPDHGTFERFVGSDRFDGCDCIPCKRGYDARRAARQSFSYYEPARKVSQHGRAAHRAWRNKQRRVA